MSVELDSAAPDPNAPYPTLLPPNATSLEKAVEQAGAARLDLPVELRTLWSAYDCPIDFLPWLAWGLSLDSWSGDWPEAVRRARVAQAIGIARRKGTAESVRSVVASFGGAVAIREWWETVPKATPHSFSLVLNLDQDGAPASAAFVDQVIGEVVRTKPARSHFTFTQGLSAAGRIGLIAAARPVISARLSCAAAPA